MALLRKRFKQDYVVHYDSSKPQNTKFDTHRKALTYHHVAVSIAIREAQELRAAGFDVIAIADNGEPAEESATAPVARVTGPSGDPLTATAMTPAEYNALPAKELRYGGLYFTDPYFKRRVDLYLAAKKQIEDQHRKALENAF